MAVQERVQQKWNPVLRPNALPLLKVGALSGRLTGTHIQPESAPSAFSKSGSRFCVRTRSHLLKQARFVSGGRPLSTQPASAPVAMLNAWWRLVGKIS